jgi:hypothetical protein
MAAATVNVAAEGRLAVGASVCAIPCNSAFEAGLARPTSEVQRGGT